MAMPLLVMILLDKPLHNQAFEAGFFGVGELHIKAPYYVTLLR